MKKKTLVGLTIIGALASVGLIVLGVVLGLGFVNSTGNASQEKSIEARATSPKVESVNFEGRSLEDTPRDLSKFTISDIEYHANLIEQGIGEFFHVKLERKTKSVVLSSKGDVVSNVFDQASRGSTEAIEATDKVLVRIAEMSGLIHSKVPNWAIVIVDDSGTPIWSAFNGLEVFNHITK